MILLACQYESEFSSNAILVSKNGAERSEQKAHRIPGSLKKLFGTNKSKRVDHAH
jgi:hypothetical protein